MARLHELFRAVHALGASDLHLAAGLEPRVRRLGELEPVEGWAPVSHRELSGWLREIVSDDRWSEYEATGDLDFAYGLDGVGRFRANYLRQATGAAAVFRRIPDRILTVEELGLPQVVAGLADLERGLVLVTGPTGSGKSTTLAAVIDRINRNYPKHVVTIEDPVEFLHRDHRCVISQREVGTDADGFEGALRAAMRQDADVILVGEMRDLETIALAVTAAEMGSLVFGTLHTNSAAKTIDRLVDVFPAEQQPQIRTTLASSLQAVVSQILLPTADGARRVAVTEILLRTSGLGNIIRTSNTPMLRSVIQSGRSRGMRSLDDSLLELARAGTISARLAYRRAEEKREFERLLREHGEDPEAG